MYITSHASCGPIVDISVTGEVRIARMTYQKKGGFPTVRHIMESGKNGQSTLQTLRGGVLKEGAMDRNNFSMRLLSEPILIEFGKDQKHPGGTHIKVVYPVFVPEEQLRDFEQEDDDDPDEIHGAITMVSAIDLIEETKGNTVPFHYRVTRSVLVWAAVEHPQVFSRYRDLVMSWSRPKLTNEQRVAIQAYPGML
ncbi:MAG: hypothetical protein Q7S49_01200 [bacterium]|nr:hypothetical protein [bacterium]